MSIFKQTLSSYVRNQLERRREAIQKIPDSKSGNFNFYHWGVERQCTIRMSSGVDIDKGTFPPSLDTPQYREEPTGIQLAQEWVLGGADYALEMDGFQTPLSENRDYYKKGKNERKEFSYEKDGVIGKTYLYQGAYGSTQFRAEAGDGYGAVPAPGIIDAQIRTKTAYGSLREAKVNWVCHNRRQLEVLEYLYMRPGYTVLLEWQNTPYINSSGEREETVIYIDEFWTKGTPLSTIQGKIIDKRKETSGNYDAIVGFVKNFEITNREDGGFNCTTIIISMGDVLDSLKGKRSGRSIKSSEGNELEVDDFEFYLKSIEEWSNYFGIKEGDVDDLSQPELKKLNDEWDQDEEAKVQQAQNNATAEFYRVYPQYSATGKTPITFNENFTAVATDKNDTEAALILGVATAQRVPLAIKYAYTKDVFNYSKYQQKEMVARGDLLIGLQELADGIKGKDRTKLFEWNSNFEDEMNTLEQNIREAQIKEREAIITKEKAKINVSKEKQLNTVVNANASSATIYDVWKVLNEDKKVAKAEKVIEETVEDIIDVQKDFGSERYQQVVSKYTNELDKEVTQIEKILDPFIIREGETIVQDTLTRTFYGSTYKNIPSFQENVAVGVSKHNYIRWDFVCWLINNFVMPTSQPGEPLTGFTCLEENNNRYLDYAASFSKDEEIEIPKFTNISSGNAGDQPGDNASTQDAGYVDLTPEDGKFNLDEILDASYNPDIALLPHQLLYGSKFSSSEIFKSSKVLGDFQNSLPSISPRSIGLVYLKVNYLIETYKSLRYDRNGGLRKDFSLLEFTKQVWEKDITGACANSHNFKIVTENNHRGYSRVIDLGFQTGLTKKNLYNLKVQSSAPDVRDFSFNTVIDSKLSSTIAIAAQAPDDMDDLEQLTVKAFNKNVTNRFSKSPSTKNYKSKRTEDEQDLIIKANKLKFYLDEMLMGEFAKDFGGTKWTEGNKINVIQVSTAINLARRINDLRYNLSVKYNLEHKKAGELKSNIKLQKSAIIPLTFNAKMDGIGGLIIGNVFRIDNSRLPLGYQNDDIGFIITKESQNITSGQDWTTDIAGQLIILDVNKEKRKGTILTKGGNEGCYVGLAQLKKDFSIWLINASEFPESARDRINELVPTSDWVNHPKLSFASRVTTGYTEWLNSQKVNNSTKPEATNDVSMCLDQHPTLCGDITQLPDSLMQDIATAAANVPELLEVEVTYSRYLYTKDSGRHWTWNAVDLSRMDCGNGLKSWNGLDSAIANGCITSGTHDSGTPGSSGDDKYSNLKGPMVDFVNNLNSMAKPYTINMEGGGGGQPQAVLYFGFPGHHHHIHVSNTE